MDLLQSISRRTLYKARLFRVHYQPGGVLIKSDWGQKCQYAQLLCRIGELPGVVTVTDIEKLRREVTNVPT